MRDSESRATVTIPGDPPLTRNSRRMTKAKVNRLGLEYRCNGCGTHILTIEAGSASKKPKAAARMLESAGTRHRAATGCRGAPEKDPQNLPIIRTATT